LRWASAARRGLGGSTSVCGNGRRANRTACLRGNSSIFVASGRSELGGPARGSHLTVAKSGTEGRAPDFFPLMGCLSTGNLRLPLVAPPAASVRLSPSGRDRLGRSISATAARERTPQRSGGQHDGCVAAKTATDPLLPFKIGPVNGRKARESGLRLKAKVAWSRSASWWL
jgi:hypothetical protein